MQGKSYIIPKKRTSEIIGLLKKKYPSENIETIRRIEKWLIKKRGYVFQMPSPKEPVILLLSGGMDTSIIWDILMRIYKFDVYPLFLRRGQIRMPVEEKSVDYFSRYYKKVHPRYFHDPKKLTTFIPPMEIRWDITKYGNFPVNESLECRGIPMYSTLLSNYAIQYAYEIEINTGRKPRTIFSGVVGGDGMFLRYETLTAMRVNTFSAINLTTDINWQITALAIEKELGFYHEKEDLVKYADHYSLPIQHSYSCIKYSYFHCGKCRYCIGRRAVFLNAGVIDRTVYENNKNTIKFIQDKISLIAVSFIFLFRVLREMTKNFMYFLTYRY